MNYSKNNILRTALIILIFVLQGCKKFIEVNAPPTSINAENVFTNDALAASVVTGVYSRMANNILVSATLNAPNISSLAGISADELMLFSGTSNISIVQYFRNDINPNVSSLNFWNSLYPLIFDCNNAIEGISSSKNLTPAVAKQLLAELKFTRAFCYFYLVNFYGDVPLITTSDWRINSSMTRTAKSSVWQQILNDAKDAEDQLTSKYADANGLESATAERLRPNKFTASALLARCYLYLNDYSNAELAATKVIANSSLFALESPNNAFLSNNREAIWQWQRTLSGGKNTPDAQLFILPTSGPTTSLPFFVNPQLVRLFDVADQRRTNWLARRIVGTDTFYYPFKYKVNNSTAPASEYTTVFRLAEQYLIRAEARANLNKISESQSDLNIIRSRAGLSNTNANTPSSLLTAISQERRLELFTEFGHRWLDLKRTGTVDAVMSLFTPLKGGTWQSSDQLYPIPVAELQKAPQLIQNPGY